MTLRRLPAVIVVALLAASGSASAATYTTPNFVVSAPDEALARKFGDMAEYYRKEKALAWLGQEMPTWPRRCPLKVEINQGGAGGATTFTFGGDGNRPIVTSQQMEIHGPAKQLLNSVLPHEITHTVLAHHFGRPVPRWADEGGSVLSENDEERFNHDVRCRELLNAGRGIRLRVLFPMAEYPRDMIVLYAQGYSVSAYLVERGGGGREGRAKLLQFLAIGMQGGSSRQHGTVETWTAAAQQVYGVESVDALEGQWLTALKEPPSRVAARNNGNAAPATPTGRGTELAAVAPSRADVRSSAAPAIPVLEPPVKAARGTAPEFEPVGTGPAFTETSERATRPVAPDRPPPVLLPPEIPRPSRQ
jgi:hypothetical protein